MKSVTIRDKRTGEIIVKVIRKKNGEYELTRQKYLEDSITVDVREDNGSKVTWI